MKKLVIINVVLILGLLLVPAVSAYESTLTESKVISKDYNFIHASCGGYVLRYEQFRRC